ncbi:MAG: hypothetical protein QM766_11085 [Burkholderiaceae bacterium]
MAADIVFGIVTSIEDPASIRQLVDSLGSDCRVVIHHDTRKTPAPAFGRPNVTILPDPVATDWGAWGFCQAIIKTIRHAVDTGACDYYQLLSGSCLPIKPIASFREAMLASPYDVNMDLLDLDADEQARYSHGARVFARRGTLPGRLLQRAALWYLGDSMVVTQRQNLGIEHRADPPGRPLPPKARIGRLILDAGRAGWFGRHPFHGRWHPYVACNWFGCKRPVAEMLANLDPDDPLERYFSRMPFADEAYFGSRIGNSGFRIGPANHLVSRFEQSNPVRLTPDDLPMLRRSSAFFARKFPREADAPVRRLVLDQLAHPPPAGTALAASGEVPT